MDTATALVKMYQEFYKVRIEHLGSRSYRSLRYIFKTISFQTEYLDLLENEHEYQKLMSAWLNEYIAENDLSGEQISRANITFRLFREELTGRNLFLIVFMVLLGVSGSFYNSLSEILGAYAHSIIIGINALFAFLAVWERGKVVLHITISNQLQILLDKWLADNASL